MTAVQLTFEGLPLDPAELAKLAITERAKLYTELDLHPIQRQAAEDAVRLIVAGRYAS